MSTLRIRFRFNQQTGASSYKAGGTKAGENFARVIVDDVAFSYSEGLFEKLKRDVGRRMKADIDRELQHMANMFMYGVIGIPGRNRGPIGTMSAVAPKADSFDLPLDVPIKFVVPNWARRSAKYLRGRHKTDWKSQHEKKNDRGANHDRPWFRRKSPGVLDRMRARGTWTSAYGGISVTLTKPHETFRPRDPGARAFEKRLTGVRAGTARVGVAHIRVAAMQRITPAMLPAVGGGALNDFGSNPRGTGLLSLLGTDIANRLGGNPARVPFRPTVQPFIGFFLTRQLPNAVMKRIEQGMQGRLNDKVGSAGRATGAARTAALRASGVLPKF